MAYTQHCEANSATTEPLYWFAACDPPRYNVYRYTFPCVGVCTRVDGLVPSAVVVSKRLVPVSWCDELVRASIISSVSRAFSVINNSPPAKNSTCSMRTGSSAKTTISLSSKVTDSIRFVDTLRYEHVYSHKAAQKKKKSTKIAIYSLASRQTSGTPNQQLNTAA